MNTLPAIVIAGYNRPESLKRLLDFVAKAHYPDEEVTLVISLDFGGGREVAWAAEEFNWTRGPKQIIHRPNRMGLKAHLLACGDLTAVYGSIILLEDDLGVSPYFYDYAVKVMNHYGEDPELAGFSLYSHQLAESNSFYPFQPADPACDVYFIQYAISWGQCWTHAQWKPFKDWLIGQKANFILREPSYLKKWSQNSWKRDFILYMIWSNTYFVCPTRSLSTNFGEPGMNFGQRTGQYQVPLLNTPYSFSFVSRAATVNVYDAWFELEPGSIKELVPGLDSYDFEVDFYGSKRKGQDLTRPWVLTVQPVNQFAAKWGMRMKPLEQNLIFDIEGDDLFLALSAEVKTPTAESNLVHYMHMHELHYPLPQLKSRLWYTGRELIHKVIYSHTVQDGMKTVLGWFGVEHKLRIKGRK